MRRPPILVVQIIGVLPDVEGEDGLKAVSDGVVGAGVLSNGQLAGGVGLEPDPAGAKEGDAFGFEFSFESIHTSPLLRNLSKKRRFLHSTSTLLHNLLQGHRFELRPGNQLVKVVERLMLR